MDNPAVTEPEAPLRPRIDVELKAVINADMVRLCIAERLHHDWGIDVSPADVQVVDEEGVEINFGGAVAYATPKPANRDYDDTEDHRWSTER